MLPLVSVLMNLYSMLVPGGKLTVTDHSGLLDVYWLAESATASDVSQDPNCSTEPTIETLSPYVVAISPSNVTATAVVEAQAVLVVADTWAEDADEPEVHAPE